MSSRRSPERAPERAPFDTCARNILQLIEQSIEAAATDSERRTSEALLRHLRANMDSDDLPGSSERISFTGP